MNTGWGLPQGPVPSRGGRRTPVRHLLVLVPGIGGSALHRADGTPLWAIDPAAGRRPIRAFRELAAPGDLLRDSCYDDGVRATQLMSLPVPGLTRLLGGYRDLRRALFRRFDLVEGQTYTEFPYDWRRPAAHNAALLDRHIRERLTRLRRRYPGAEVVIVAHSMGGLVAREYVERHDQHRTVRALITLGTPFRGAVKALDFLVNGPRVAKVRFASLAEEFGRLPALYELLPLYPFIRLGTAPDAPLAGIEAVRHLLAPGANEHVARAAAFLDRLNQSEHPTATRPFVGFGAPTPQQAVLSGSRLTVMRGSHLLPGSHAAGDGDGTVPLVSATPRSGEALRLPSTPQNQTHAGLVTGRDTLQSLLIQIADLVREGQILQRGRLAEPSTAAGTDAAPSAVTGDLPSAATDAAPSAADGATPSPAAPPGADSALRLDVEDWYDADEPLSIPGRAPAHAGSLLWYRLDDADPAKLPVEDDGTFTVRADRPAEGVQRLDVLTAPDGDVLLTEVVEAV
ncbi:alpha/beta fold hydrolase [Streptomyces sp. NPDC058739]|uniref:alpha/beta fold hydrolase n=1 Tax=Streptomyces sp. NPDC058739 TaxID=3346618 RepID=UPI003686039D